MLVPTLLCLALTVLLATTASVRGCGVAVHNEVAERARAWFSVTDSADLASLAGIEQYQEILKRNPKALQAGAMFPDCLNLDEGLLKVLANAAFNGDVASAHELLDVGGDFAIRHMDDLGYLQSSFQIPITDVIAIYKMLGIDVPFIELELCMARQVYALQAVQRFGEDLFPTYASQSPMLNERLEDYFLGGITSMATQTHRCWRILISWFERGDFSRTCLFDDIGRGSGTMGRQGAGPTSALPASHPSMAEHLLGLVPQVVYDSELSVSRSDEGIIEIELSTKPDAAGSVTAIKNRGHGPGSRQRYLTPSLNKRSGRPARTTLDDSHAARIKLEDICESLDQQFATARIVYSTPPYSGFGTAVALGDFDGDGVPDLAVSAPTFTNGSQYQFGAVFVEYGPANLYKSSQQDIQDSADQTLSPPLMSATSHGRHLDSEQGLHQMFPNFGSALAVVDFNTDGVDDLIVGASLTGQLDDGSNGQVYVYFGHKGAGLSSLPDITIDALDLAAALDHAGEPGKAAANSKVRIGNHIFSDDVNGDGVADLVIGAPYSHGPGEVPQAGMVFVYLSSPIIQPPSMHPQPDIILSSPSPLPYEWFGTSFKSIYTAAPDGEGLTLVGAPGRPSKYRGRSLGLAGHVHAFRVVNATTVVPYFGLESTEPNRQLGSVIERWENPDSDQKGSYALLGSPSISNSLLGRLVSPEVLPNKPPLPGWQAGDVRVMDPLRWRLDVELAANRTSGRVDIDGNDAMVAWLQGYMTPGHFGRAIAPAGHRVWIGEPFSHQGTRHPCALRPSLQSPTKAACGC
ncbi:hypothetical protein EV182_000432 [Spiromyces aspiralis]|uniref:Uncharacterized protein n=1 Tax=Spiromyces aspiralis TaxID=68401 RepID=A0ACC1HI31_9FUNG|nr:hypothetical protein EV182_000432 [Spiromyces aspiralis]